MDGPPFDTTLPGHLYGTGLAEADKQALLEYLLLEYLKTL